MTNEPKRRYRKLPQMRFTEDEMVTITLALKARIELLERTGEQSRGVLFELGSARTSLLKFENNVVGE